MPYATNDDLPPSIKLHLPPHAQDIFRTAFNSAWDSYRVKESWRLDEVAHRVAWAAVKQRYRKLNGQWILRERPD
jgi:cation transport regulator